MGAPKKRIAALDALGRIQDMRIDRAREEHAERQRDFEAADDLFRRAFDRAEAAERALRDRLSRGESLELEDLRRDQRHLAQLHEQTHERARARDEASESLERARQQLSRSRQEREGTTRLRDRARRARAVVEARREAQALDEAWLLGRAGRGGMDAG